jgi:hypothetical protein
LLLGSGTHRSLSGRAVATSLEFDFLLTWPILIHKFGLVISGEIMPNVKVSIDQWAVTTMGRADLFTDGLSGCVAVCLSSDDQIGLTHVLAGSHRDDDWRDYQENLRLMVVVMEAVSPVLSAVLVYSEDGQNQLAIALERCLAGYGINIQTTKHLKASGCRIAGARPYSMRNQPPRPYRSYVHSKESEGSYAGVPYLPVSIAGGTLLDNWGTLRDGAQDCDPFVAAH